MKTMKYISVLAAIALLTACSKDFLDRDYKNQPTPDRYWKDAKDAEQTITTCYAPIKFNGMYGVTMQYIYHAMDPYVKNEGGDYLKYQSKIFFSDDNRVASIYRTLYSGVNRCNLALEKIPEISMDEQLKNRCLGEAHFLRALYNYYLTTLFYQPPLIKKFLEKFEDYNSATNAPQDTIFAFIIDDLTTAIDLLPMNSEYSAAEMGRATKGAAYALLGKSYMWQHNWQLASDAFKKIIDQEVGSYELIQPKSPMDSLDYVYAYLCNFSMRDLVNGSNVYPSENNRESIFEIQNAETQFDQWQESLDGYGTDGSLYTSYFSLYGWNNIGADTTFLNSFEAPKPETNLSHDPRLYASAYSGDTIRCWNDISDVKKLCGKVAQPTGRIPGSMPIKKYMFPVYCGTNENKSMDPNNWRLIRYSDVLLLYAEARHHLGDDAEAFLKLNEVRSRAGMPDASGDFKTALLKERKFEFCFETSLFSDLVRLHMIENSGSRFIDIHSYIPNFVIGKHEYLPIPRIEIDYMNGTLVQNQNW